MGISYGKPTGTPEFNVRASGLVRLPHGRGATAEGWRRKGQVASAGPEGTDHNGLDENAKVRIGELRNGGGYFVKDDGRGIDGGPEQIARLFSISRPMVSTKLLRLPKRGALGNGLRVVETRRKPVGGMLTARESLA
jgi:hypothetical protein